VLDCVSCPIASVRSYLMEKGHIAKTAALVGFGAMFLLGGTGGAQSAKSPQT
jgi:hypothetical protein